MGSNHRAADRGPQAPGGDGCRFTQLCRKADTELGRGLGAGSAADMAGRRDPRLMDFPRRILILAPHPDDEIVACGIAAMRATAAGAAVFVLYLTSGVPPIEAQWRWRRRQYPAMVTRRQSEAIRAATLLGLRPMG